MYSHLNTDEIEYVSNQVKIPFLNLKMCKLSEIAKKIRLQIIEQSHTSGTPHLFSCLSIVDALVAMYWGCLIAILKKSRIQTETNLY